MIYLLVSVPEPCLEYSVYGHASPTCITGKANYDLSVPTYCHSSPHFFVTARMYGLLSVDTNGNVVFVLSIARGPFRRLPTAFERKGGNMAKRLPVCLKPVE